MNTWQEFAAENRTGLTVSVIGHALLLAAFSSSLILIPRQPIPQLAIEAVVVDPSKLRQAPKVEPAQQRQVEQRQREEQARQERLEKERRETELKRQKEADAAAVKRRQDQQRKEAEAKAQAQRQREQAEAERKERERQAAEERARAEKERKEAEARAREEAQRKEQARRQAELMAAMEAEEALVAAQSSGELARYLALIQQKVERNWVPPASVGEGLECEVAVQQLPNGDVVDARTISCNGDAAVQRSVENAVRRSSPLPLPENRALFERNLRFIFKPEQ